MSIRLLALGLLCLGAVGQMACSTDAEAAQESVASDINETKTKKPGEGQFCGGFAGIQCPEKLICVDNPSDDCDPNAGGRDCAGICVDPDKDKGPTCEGDTDPTKSYVLRNPDKCAAIDVQCPEGSTAFFDDCGCGCQPAQSACTYQEPNRRYVSQDATQCETLRFTCDTGEQAFFDACGCGCEPAPAP